MSTISRRVALLLIMAIVATGCGGGSDGGDSGQPEASGEATTAPKRGGVFRMATTEPRWIDPALGEFLISKRLFVGLTTFDGNPELKMRPAVAETWSSNPDCTQWTFNLRPNTFSNGEDVTAESFIRGWTRAADGRAASQVAAHLAGIDGYRELHGEAASPPTATTFSGLSAPNPQTLVVRLNAADCEFDKKTNHTVMSPVPSVAGAADNKAFNEAPIGNGPFMFKPGTKWEHDKGISLVRSESYFGTKPNIDGIEFVIYPSQSFADNAYKAFQAGELDIASVPQALRRQADETYTPQGGFIRHMGSAVSYLIPNTARGPMANPDARRAVSLSIDRDLINRSISQGYASPATTLIPPMFGTFHQPGVCEACRPDPARARELALRGGLGPGTRVRFVTGATGAGPQALKDMLEKTLEIVVDLETLPSREALAKQAAGDFDIGLGSWHADYPTPDNYLFPLLARGSGENYARYSNPEFDALVPRWRAEKSESERRRIFLEAERMAIGRDQALIPYFYLPHLMVFDAQRWTGVSLDFFDIPSFETMSLK